MSSRRSDIPGTADAVLNGLTAETAVQLLLQIPTIMAAVGEIRQILAGRQKPLLTIEEFGALTGRAPYTSDAGSRSAASRPSGSRGPARKAGS